MVDNISGGCLCGAVTYSVENKFSAFHFCHCEQCRKITGSSHASNLFAKVDAIEWFSGLDNIKRFDYPNRGFTKAFCGECGSGVPFVSLSGKVLLVPAGSLNESPHLLPEDNIFWVERASWFDKGIYAECFDGFPE